MTNSGTQVFAFCLLLIKWQKRGEVRLTCMQPLPLKSVSAPGSKSREEGRERETESERECRTSPFILPREKRGMQRGKSQHSASSFRDFLIEGKAIPSGPRRHGPDYSNHYKGDENNSLLKARVLLLLFIILFY